jgi:hypothetical protein
LDLGEIGKISRKRFPFSVRKLWEANHKKKNDRKSKNRVFLGVFEETAPGMELF